MRGPGPASGRRRFGSPAREQGVRRLRRVNPNATVTSIFAVAVPVEFDGRSRASPPTGRPPDPPDRSALTPRRVTHPPGMILRTALDRCKTVPLVGLTSRAISIAPAAVPPRHGPGLRARSKPTDLEIIMRHLRADQPELALSATRNDRQPILAPVPTMDAGR